jgi:hypothetical protein
MSFVKIVEVASMEIIKSVMRHAFLEGFAKNAGELLAEDVWERLKESFSKKQDKPIAEEIEDIEEIIKSYMDMNDSLKDRGNEIYINKILRILKPLFSFKQNKSIQDYIIRLLEFSIDEEWRGFTGEQQYEWNKVGLTKNQINRKTLIFFAGLYWGELKSWFQILSILSWVKSQLTYQ